MIRYCRYMQTQGYEALAKLLSPLGLSQNEMKVFLCLFQFGSQTIQGIANLLSLPRTTVQSIVERLVQQDLILIGQISIHQSYLALSLTELLVYIETRKQQRQTFKENVIEQQEMIALFQINKQEKPIVTYCKGSEIERLMYDKVLEANYCDAVWDIESSMRFFNISEEHVFQFPRLARKKTRRILIDCIYAKAYQEKFQSDSYEIKIISSHQGKLSDFGLIPTTVFHISYENPLQPLGMIIQDKAFYGFQSAMFEAMRRSL